MKIGLISDTHSEFRQAKEDLGLFDPEVDLWLAPGDIGIGAKGIFWLRQQLNDAKNIIFVAGNHEYYNVDGRTMADIQAEMRRAALDNGITYLENEYLDLRVNDEECRVIGATLWTDFRVLDHVQPRIISMAAVERGLNDYKRIWNDEGGLLRAIDTARLHEESVAFIQSMLETKFDGTTVVLTHHAPLYEASLYKGKETTVTPGFGSNLQWMIEKFQPDFWLYGHTHEPFDITIGNTRVATNPLGYPREIKTRFSPLIMETKNADQRLEVQSREDFYAKIFGE